MLASLIFSPLFELPQLMRQRSRLKVIDKRKDEARMGSFFYDGGIFALKTGSAFKGFLTVWVSGRLHGWIYFPFPLACQKITSEAFWVPVNDSLKILKTPLDVLRDPNIVFLSFSLFFSGNEAKNHRPSERSGGFSPVSRERETNL